MQGPARRPRDARGPGTGTSRHCSGSGPRTPAPTGPAGVVAELFRPGARGEGSSSTPTSSARSATLEGRRGQDGSTASSACAATRCSSPTWSTTSCGASSSSSRSAARRLDAPSRVPFVATERATWLLAAELWAGAARPRPAHRERRGPQRRQTSSRRTRWPRRRRGHRQHRHIGRMAEAGTGATYGRRANEARWTETDACAETCADCGGEDFDRLVP